LGWCRKEVLPQWLADSGGAEYITSVIDSDAPSP